MKTLGELVKTKPTYVVSRGQTVLEVVRYMTASKVGAVPVLDGDRLVGIFSERDLMTRCIAKGIDIAKTKIDDVMTRKVVLMESDDTYEDCMKIMKQESIRHIPVTEGDKLIGVASMRDLMEADVEEKEQKIDVLHSYIHYNPKGKT